MTEDDRWQATWHGLQDILGPKWTFHILRLLSAEPRGFNAIRDELSGLNAPILSRRLKELRCHGLVDRVVEDTTPPTTSYSLTEQGAVIADQLQQLESLVELHDPTAGDSRRGAEDCSDAAGACRNEALGSGCVTAVDQC